MLYYYMTFALLGIYSTEVFAQRVIGALLNFDESENAATNTTAKRTVMKAVFVPGGSMVRSLWTMWPKVPHPRRFIRPIGGISPPVFSSLGNNPYYVSNYELITSDSYLRHHQYSRYYQYKLLACFTAMKIKLRVKIGRAHV